MKTLDRMKNNHCHDSVWNLTKAKTFDWGHKAECEWMSFKGFTIVNTSFYVQCVDFLCGFEEIRINVCFVISMLAPF